MHTLSAVTPEAVRDLLATIGEQTDIASLSPERRDWRWHVELPGDRMLLVPVDAEGAQRLRRERRLLATIGPRLDFAVPRSLGNVDAAIDIRQRVAGESGARLHYSVVEDSARAELFADDLARVLAGLHTALAPDELLALVSPVRDDDYPLAEPLLRAVVPSLPAEIRALAHAALDRYAALPTDDVVLVHNDLAMHNLAFEPTTYRVAGVFDFEGAARADRHLDFKYLPSYGPRITARVLERYRELTGVTISVERMRLLHFATALSYWVWRERDPESHDRLSGRNRDIAVAWIGLAVYAIGGA